MLLSGVLARSCDDNGLCRGGGGRERGVHPSLCDRIPRPLQLCGLPALLRCARARRDAADDRLRDGRIVGCQSLFATVTRRNGARLQRIEKRKQRPPRCRIQTPVAFARQGSFPPVLLDRFIDGRGTPIVQHRPAESEPPQRRRPDLVSHRCVLLDAVAGVDVVQQEIRKQRHEFPIEQRIR
jgi:hypothetical protein